MTVIENEFGIQRVVGHDADASGGSQLHRGMTRLHVARRKKLHHGIRGAHQHPGSLRKTEFRRPFSGHGARHVRRAAQTGQPFLPDAAHGT